ncbi:MAG: DNA-3-methyladenine glycosylase I [Candidatus Dojkabacteria bacterium]
MKKRCEWAGDDPDYVKYHDEEWGVPTHDDRILFEFLVLESMQAGLSWLTVLRKRENFREAFAGFDPIKVAKYNEKDVSRLMNDAGIIRNMQKINAAINNATIFLKIQKEFGSFDKYMWSFGPLRSGKPIKNTWRTMADLPSKTKLSDEISGDMKKRGFKFVGSTIIYAHMQATGMVNDHITDCFRYTQV